MGGSNHTLPFDPNPQALPLPPTHPLYSLRAPPEPPAPPEEGEVLYTHVVSTKQPGGESGLGHTQRDTSPMSVPLPRCHSQCLSQRPPVPPHSRIPR